MNRYLRLLLRDQTRLKDYTHQRDSTEHGLCAQSLRNLRLGASRRIGG
jgi:hypothetical protein